MAGPNASAIRDTDGRTLSTGQSARSMALKTCNTWAASRLRLAGVKTSLWPPFVQGLTWRYRKVSAD